MKTVKKGFVIVIVVAFLAVLSLIGWVIVNIGCGEIMGTTTYNNTTSAYYIAVAGAEFTYSTMKSLSIVTWPLTQNGTLSAGGTQIGSYSVSAQQISSSEFLIVSEGSVNGRKSKVTVRYGYSSDPTIGVPLASIGAMAISGASNSSKVSIQGPVISSSTITTNTNVNITGGTYQNTALSTPSFWLTGTSDVYPSPSGNGTTDDDDAFYYYYTTYLNGNPPSGYSAPLGIGEGQSGYYSGNQTFEPDDINEAGAIIFVDGNVTITKESNRWISGVHTIVATGNITIYQPTNRPGDVLTLVSHANVTTSGEMGNQGGSVGEFIVYADGNFTATDGGRTDGSIFAKGIISIDTLLSGGSHQRKLNKSGIDWSDVDNMPLGLPDPYNYNKVSPNFTINETTHKTIWQKE